MSLPPSSWARDVIQSYYFGLALVQGGQRVWGGAWCMGFGLAGNVNSPGDSQAQAQSYADVENYPRRFGRTLSSGLVNTGKSFCIFGERQEMPPSASP